MSWLRQNRTARAGGRLLVGAASSLVVSACGSSTPPATTTTSTSTTTTIAAAKNLIATPALKRSLLDAAAAYHQLPTSDFVGLQPGTTYYAFDPATNTFYASAGPRASPHSLAAQVGTQDDGAYNLFTRHSGTATWTVYNDGLGAAQGSICPITIPAAVLAVWNWTTHRCYPPTS